MAWETRAATAAMVLALTAGAADIRVSSDPPLPTANLLQNPGLEEGGDGRPVAWTFGTATPAIFQSAWREDGRSGRCLWLKADSGEMSGYWAQSVPVEPGRTYLASGYMRLNAGKVLCYVHGTAARPDGRQISIDERLYRGTMRGHWLIPVFLPPDALGGPDPAVWYPFRLRFTVPPPIDRVAFSLGLYFAAGEASFDDLCVSLAEAALLISVTPATGETLRQVTVTSPGAPKPVFDSGELPAGTSPFETRLAGQPADGQWTVTVRLSDGRQVSRRYPESEGKVP